MGFRSRPFFRATARAAPDSRRRAGWPLLLWAHGTTGVARQSAPPTKKSLGYYVPELVQQGFAVVAVDYAGMGTDNGGTEYLTKTSNALDTFNAVPAVQHAVLRDGAAIIRRHPNDGLRCRCSK